MIPRHLEASFCGAERIAKAASSPNMFCESLKYFSLMNRNRPSRTNAVLIFSKGGEGASPLLLRWSEDARFEKLTTVLSRIRKTFYRFELLWELLRQASLHNEAVQDSWTALYFGLGCRIRARPPVEGRGHSCRFSPGGPRP